MKSFTQHFTEEHFSLTPTVVLLALFFSLVVGEALVLGVSLKVGFGVAVAVFFVQIIFFGEWMEGISVFGQHFLDCRKLFVSIFIWSASLQIK